MVNFFEEKKTRTKNKPGWVLLPFYNVWTSELVPFSTVCLIGEKKKSQMMAEKMRSKM